VLSLKRKKPLCGIDLAPNPMRRSSPLSFAALLIVACGSPQGLDEDQFPDQYAGQVSASGGTSGSPPVGTGGTASGSGGTASNGGSGNLGGSSGAPATNGGSGGGGAAGSGNASGTGGTGSNNTGTGGTGGGQQQPPPSGNCPDDITVLFNRPSAQGGCADGGCHTAGGFPPDLVSPNVEMRLLNVASTCQSRPLIGASDSFLAEKIENPAPACGGAQMPFFATQNLNAADRQCILDWIDEVGGGG
jgi:hypothetical protein